MIADAGGAERQVKREKEGRGQSIPASSTSTISDNVEGRGRAQHRGLWLNTGQNNHGIRGLAQSGKGSRPLSTAAMAVNVFFASAARLFFSVKRPPRFFPASRWSSAVVSTNPADSPQARSTSLLAIEPQRQP